MQDNDDMNAPVTRTELRAGLEQGEVVSRRMIVEQFSAELARHTTAIIEQLRSEIRAVGERLHTVPEDIQGLLRRVERLEERVFAAPPPSEYGIRNADHAPSDRSNLRVKIRAARCRTLDRFRRRRRARGEN